MLTAAARVTLLRVPFRVLRRGAREMSFEPGQQASPKIGYTGGEEGSTDKPTVVFVLGGPGAGKGTQCAKIVRDFGFTHLSAGELLREHMQSGSEEGNMVAETIQKGQIVPSYVTINLLLGAMERARQERGARRFLIDGFPRNAENRDAWEATAGYDCEFVLFFVASQETLEKRLTSRKEGRSDDNSDTIRGRFKTFMESSLPVIQHYEKKGKVARIQADGSPEEVYSLTIPFFEPFVKHEVLQTTRRLLASIDTGDYETYKSLCDEGLTSFEPEAKGGLVEGMTFHKFYFDAHLLKKRIAEREAGPPQVMSTISNPTVRLLGPNAAVVTYTRLVQRMFLEHPNASSLTPQSQEGNSSAHSPPVGTSVNLPKTDVFEETRVWQRRESDGQWINVHFHRSRPSD